MKIKTYVINLKESVDRRKIILEETLRYPCMDVEMVGAINGRRMSSKDVKDNFDVLKFTYRYRRTPKRGEIGCVQSHRECYKRLLESGEEFALILEDDAVFYYPERVETMINETVRKLKKSIPHLISFSTHAIYYTKSVYQIDDFFFYRLWDAYGACGYLINKKAAERLLKISRPSIVADDFTYMKNIGILVEGIYPTFMSGGSCIDKPSEIQNDCTDFVRLSDLPFWHQLKHCWARFYYESLLFLKILSFRNYFKDRN
ncbi:glycosyltransferase family 25 protein [Parabacteroides sp.]